jgi:hypothetical protein
MEVVMVEEVMVEVMVVVVMVELLVVVRWLWFSSFINSGTFHEITVAQRQQTALLFYTLRFTANSIPICCSMQTPTSIACIFSLIITSIST